MLTGLTCGCVDGRVLGLCFCTRDDCGAPKVGTRQPVHQSTGPPKVLPLPVVGHSALGDFSLVDGNSTAAAAAAVPAAAGAPHDDGQGDTNAEQGQRQEPTVLDGRRTHDCSNMTSLWLQLRVLPVAETSSLCKCSWRSLLYRTCVAQSVDIRECGFILPAPAPFIGGWGAGGEEKAQRRRMMRTGIFIDKCAEEKKHRMYSYVNITLNRTIKRDGSHTRMQQRLLLRL